MSPRELYREMEAARGRQRDEADAIETVAWLTASYAMKAFAGKLPPLKGLLEKSHTATAPLQSKQAMAATVRTLAEYYGQPIRRTS